MSLLVFLVMISILIFVHEFGHFIMAKRVGIKVEKFSLGFGKKLFSFKFQDTEFSLCLILFGGYVKLAGDSRETAEGKPWEYLSKSPLQRAKVVGAGPLFNYLLAFFFLWILYLDRHDRNMFHVVSGYILHIVIQLRPFPLVCNLLNN